MVDKLVLADCTPRYDDESRATGRCAPPPPAATG